MEILHDARSGENRIMLNTLYGNLQLPAQDLLKVKGIESVRMYPTQPNSRIALFDEDETSWTDLQTPM